jgi:hypothetical protein
MNKKFNEEMLKQMPLEMQQEAFKMASKMILDKLSPTAGTMFSFGIMLGAFEAVCKMVKNKGDEVEIPVSVKKVNNSSRKSKNKKRIWTKEEDAEIIKNFRLMKCKQLGEILGRTSSAVSQRAIVLGLRKYNKNQTTI